MAPDETPATLAGIRAIEQAATPGEWRHRTAEGRGDWTSGSKTYSVERVEADAIPGGVAIFDAWADAEFTAMARTAIPLLLAAIEDLTKALEHHRPRFTSSTGTELCGGCLSPAPCKDDPERIVTAALAGKDSSDGN